MSRWEEFQKKSEQPERPEGREIGGVYMCQLCNKMVLNATYFPVDSLLRYVCEDGHKSYIEGFKVSI